MGGQKTDNQPGPKGGALDRRSRLRAKAAAAGMLREVPVRPVSPALRRRILESTRGLGPVVNAALAAERDRV